MWHSGEPVEIAALQLLNVLFSVPQVSVRLQEIPPDHLAMVHFYLSYWNANRAVLLDGTFEAPLPAANYPLLTGRSGRKQISALYADMLVRLDGRATDEIDIINAKNSSTVVLSIGQDLGPYRYTIRNCQGQVVQSARVRLSRGTRSWTVPVSGLLSLRR